MKRDLPFFPRLTLAWAAGAGKCGVCGSRTELRNRDTWVRLPLSLPREGLSQVVTAGQSGNMQQQPPAGQGGNPPATTGQGGNPPANQPPAGQGGNPPANQPPADQQPPASGGTAR